jgi:hypothetical protein
MITVAMLMLLTAPTTLGAARTVAYCFGTEVMRVTPEGLVPSQYMPQNHLPMSYSEVRVTVNSDGSVKSVRLIHSCGATGCDNGSLNHALHSVYRPRTVNCKPVEGTYEYIQVFVIG